MLNRLKRQDGILNLFECFLVAASCFCLSIIAAGSLGSKILGEIGDVGAAIGSLNQSYTLTGYAVGHPNDLSNDLTLMPPVGAADHAGCDYNDSADYCDQGASCGLRACITASSEAPGGGD